MLGCGGEAEDRLEHYVHCQVSRAVAVEKLRITPSKSNANDRFFLNGDGEDDNDNLACLALLHYACYCTTNGYRNTDIRDRERAKDAMGQHLKNAVRGHAPSITLLDNRWLAGVDNRHPMKRRRVH